MNDNIYDALYGAICESLAKHAEAMEAAPAPKKQKDEQRAAVKTLAAGGAGVGTYMASRSGNLKQTQTLGSRLSRGSAKIRRGAETLKAGYEGRAPQLKTVPRKRMKAVGRMRAGARGVGAGLAAGYLVGKGYDAVKGGKKQES